MDREQQICAWLQERWKKSVKRPKARVLEIQGHHVMVTPNDHSRGEWTYRIIPIGSASCSGEWGRNYVDKDTAKRAALERLADILGL